ncbi:S1/P1 nuclease [Amanita muscaria]
MAKLNSPAQFLAPNALAFVQQSLGSNYSESLGPAATWADQVKYTAGYTWSQPYHYVDAQDNPPSSCSVDQTRDCGDGKCILNAIANYTSRVVDTSLSAASRQEALKFLDIGQPLHVEALEVGGNDISVICSGSTTNLHAVGYEDTSIIQLLLKSSYSNDVTTWANSLASRIQFGDFAASASAWISCSDTTVPAKRSFEEDISELLNDQSVQPLHCPLTWAADSNTSDCSYVFSYTNGTDLCTSNYYTGAVPIIETQVAKQGYRLAAWLNVLFDGSTNLS